MSNGIPHQAAEVIPLPDKKYTIIYADPPWALAANVSLTEAKKLLVTQYPSLTVTFKII